MRWMRKRLNEEEGFTLIELMVVVLIIAVLVAIAVPSFLGFRNRAQDRAAQADLRNVLLAEKAFWTDFGEYAYAGTNYDFDGDTVTTTAEEHLKGYEPSIQITNTAANTLVATDPAGAYQSVAGNNDVVCIVKVSSSGNQFAIFEDASATGGTFYWSGAEGSSPCPAAAGDPGGTWSTNGFPPGP